MAQINTYSPSSDARVVVQYQRDMSVGIGVQRKRSAQNVRVAADGEALAVAAEDFVFDEHGGEWMDLDRPGINNLIRSLREARDKAFGKDE